MAEGNKAIITTKLCGLILYTMRYWITSGCQANSGWLPSIWRLLATALEKLLISESPIALLFPDKAD